METPPEDTHSNNSLETVNANYILENPWPRQKKKYSIAFAKLRYMEIDLIEQMQEFKKNGWKLPKWSYTESSDDLENTEYKNAETVDEAQESMEAIANMKPASSSTESDVDEDDIQAILLMKSQSEDALASDCDSDVEGIEDVDGDTTSSTDDDDDDEEEEDDDEDDEDEFATDDDEVEECGKPTEE